jgi:hypothetical protein
MWLYLLAGLMMLGGAALVLKVVVRRFKIERRVLWPRFLVWVGINYKPPPPRKGYRIQE